MSVDELTSYALASRNLALAERSHSEIIAPCAACYLVLNKTQHYIREYPSIKLVVTRALAAIGLKYHDRIKVRHPLDVLLNDVKPETIAAKVKVSLNGLKIAPYYGCQIVRPYSTFDDQRNPTSMERLLEACGAKAVHYPLKTRVAAAVKKGRCPKSGWTSSTIC